MISPFTKGHRYFVRTVTFYHIATYVSHRSGFYKFKDVSTILNITDWEDMWKSKPNLPPAYKPINVPEMLISRDAIVDVVPWG